MNNIIKEYIINNKLIEYIENLLLNNNQNNYDEILNNDIYYYINNKHNIIDLHITNKLNYDYDNKFIYVNKIDKIYDKNEILYLLNYYNNIFDLYKNEDILNNNINIDDDNKLILNSLKNNIENKNNIIDKIYDFTFIYCDSNYISMKINDITNYLKLTSQELFNKLLNNINYNVININNNIDNFSNIDFNMFDKLNNDQLYYLLKNLYEINNKLNEFKFSQDNVLLYYKFLINCSLLYFNNNIDKIINLNFIINNNLIKTTSIKYIFETNKTKIKDYDLIKFIENKLSKINTNNIYIDYIHSKNKIIYLLLFLHLN